MKIKLTAAISLFFVLSMTVMTVFGEGGDMWSKIDDTALSHRPMERTRVPDRYSAFSLDKRQMRALLSRASEEFSGKEGVIIQLPMPDGTLARFRVEHSLVVEPGLVAKYPDLGATYRGYGIDDPTASVRFDFLPSGFHAMILSPNGTVMIDPYAKLDTDNYVSYFKGDLQRIEDFDCETNKPGLNTMLDDTIEKYRDSGRQQTSPEVISGTTLRTYRLALAGNAEYCAAASVGGNTVANCLAAQVLIMNRVNGVYEKDVTLRMVMVANNDLIVYAANNMTCPVPGGATACTAGNDPYANSTADLNSNTGNLNTVIGSANYDIGHVFTTGSGGVATLNGPCGANKARGTTGLPNPVGDPFAIDFVAHEMGHQWGGNHTFNGAASNCSGGNRSAANPFEPGSGITIMAYAGICGAQNLAGNSIDTFHVRSLEEIVAYSQTGNGNTCDVETATGNTPPTVTLPLGSSFNIPRNTPFALTASATDPNPDTLTYDWQEYDTGGATGTTAVPNTDSDGTARPIFRPYLPVGSGTRFFPSLPFILNNANVPPSTNGGGFLTGELLPAITRTMNFQVIVRDNRANGGGINTATATVNVSATSGPFLVTAPNTAINWNGGTVQTVTWDVAGTTAAPINAANVKISLSADGGQTFPNVLAASTANDGSEVIVVPNNITTVQARIKVEAIGNIFFDISNANFMISTVGTSRRAPFDYDGDDRTDLSIFRPAAGEWWYQRSSTGIVSAGAFGTST
ncbi:MAG: reprolysin-like metallopeptidase, partial [Pyrinomonadaceae bacterium]